MLGAANRKGALLEKKARIIVGDPDAFAIECAINSTGTPVLGHLCLWLAGQQVGDFSSECMITMPAGQLASTLYTLGERQNPELARQDPIESLDWVWRQVYGDSDADLRESDKYYRLVWLEGPPFAEAFRSIHLDTDRGVRLVWQEADESPAGELCVPYDRYTSAIRGLLYWLQEQTNFRPDEPYWVKLQMEERFKEGRKAEARRNRLRKELRREEQRRVSRQRST